LKETWSKEDLKDHHHKYYKNKFENERKQIQWILDNIDNDGLLKVKYVRNSEIGRHQISGKVGLVTLRRVVRNYLCDGIYYDFDIKNANMSIIMYLISKYNIQGLDTIKNYHDNYERTKIAIKNHFQFNNDEFKHMMITLVYGFECEYKTKSNKMINKIQHICELTGAKKDDKIIPYLTKFIENLKILTTELQKLNIWNIDVSDKEFNQQGSWLSKCIQTVEDDIVFGLKIHLITNYPKIFKFKNTNKNVSEYEYDGFKPLVCNVAKDGLEKMNDVMSNWLVSNGYGTFISFINKPMKDKLYIEPTLKKDSKEECEDECADECIFIDEEEIESVAPVEQIEQIEQIEPSNTIEYDKMEQSPITIANSFSPIVVEATLPSVEEPEVEMIPVDILWLGHNDIARYIAPKLSKIMKYSRTLEKWIVYNERTHFWEKVKIPNATLSTYLQKSINATRFHLVSMQNKHLSVSNSSDASIEKDIKQCCNDYFRYSQKGDLSSIKDFLTTYIHDDDFISKLDNNLYQLVFQNGILDLKTMTFRQGLLKEDYLTKCIPCDYVKPSQESVNRVKGELLKICNNNIQHLDYYLSLIGYSITGDSSREQIFAYFRGQSASNGKSIILEVLEDIMPNYVKKAENKIFDISFDMKKELASFEGKRIIWVNELSKSKKEADRLKSFADGTSYSFGRNFATESEKLKILFKVVIVSNYSLNIEADNGIKRRFKLAQFNSKFDDFPDDNYERLEFKRDSNFGTLLRGDLKMALIELLAQYGNHYWNEKILKPYPNEWNEEAQENMNDNNKFDEWFNDNFTFDLSQVKTGEKGLFVGKQFMTEMLPSNLQGVKINDELKRMRVVFTYDKGKRYNSARGSYVGFGLKQEEKLEEEI